MSRRVRSRAFIVCLVVQQLSTPFHKYDHVCGEGCLARTRRERRAYPSGVCKERATTSGTKRTAARGRSGSWSQCMRRERKEALQEPLCDQQPCLLKLLSGHWCPIIGRVIAKHGV